MTMQARDDKDFFKSLMARLTWSEVISITLVRVFAVTWLVITPLAYSSWGLINAVIPKTIKVTSLLSLWEIIPVQWDNSVCCIMVLFQKDMLGTGYKLGNCPIWAIWV
jgi:hypothetical protein